VRRTGTQHGRAFSLIEAMVVVLVVGILAASAIPAANLLADMNRATASHEIVRSLELARARAMATGRPHGVRFSVTDQTMQPVWIASKGASPTAATSQSGQEQDVVPFRSFGNASLAEFVGGDGVSTEGTLWFGGDGSPQSRSGTGALLGAWASDARIRVQGEPELVIRRITGLIE